MQPDWQIRLEGKKKHIHTQKTQNNTTQMQRMLFFFFLSRASVGQSLVSWKWPKCCRAEPVTGTPTRTPNWQLRGWQGLCPSGFPFPQDKTGMENGQSSVIAQGSQKKVSEERSSHWATAGSRLKKTKKAILYKNMWLTCKHLYNRVLWVLKIYTEWSELEAGHVTRMEVH